MFGRRGAAAENKPVCKFWKNGSCRFGKDCKFRHDDDSGPSNNSNSSFNNNSNSNWNNNQNNRNNNNSNNTAHSFKNNSRLQRNNPFLLDKDSIRSDLTPGEEKPTWPLSAYGPGRDAPLQLMEGEYEVSPEELRVQCYLARANGSFEQYADHERLLHAKAMAEADRIVRDIDNAITYVQEGQTREGNRLAQVTSDSGSFRKEAPGFGQPSQMAPPSGLSTFGHTSHANQNPSFPSGLGPQGAFAQPQKPTLGGSPAFGQPTAIGTLAFGQPSQPQSTFGQPSQPQSTFGQPSFGQASQPQPSFGQPSQPQSTFGQPSQNQSPFGQQSQTRPSFGQPSSLSQPQAAQPQPQSSPFGAGNTQQQQRPSGGFSFGQPSAPFNSLTNGQTQSQPQQQQTASPFGGGFGKQSQPAASGFGQASAPSQPPTAAPQQQPQPSGFDNAANGQQSADGPRGASTTYDKESGNSYYTHPKTGKQERVWFPNGHPGPEPSAEGPPAAYEGQLGDALKSVYRTVWETGTFGDVVPEIPPKREWVNFAV